MSEEMIVEFCAPTLAGIKTGNLFSCEYDDKCHIQEDLRRINKCMVKKGVRAIPVGYLNHRVLIYVYRAAFLEKDLCDEDASMILKERGYDVTDMSKCIRCLCKRLSQVGSGIDFPHEIGLFLGYPVEDVKGFIEHKGECSKCTGCWKVYGDVRLAEKTFARFKKCTNNYLEKYRSGATLDALIVSA